MDSPKIILESFDNRKKVDARKFSISIQFIIYKIGQANFKYICYISFILDNTHTSQETKYILSVQNDKDLHQSCGILPSAIFDLTDTWFPFSTYAFTKKPRLY